MSVATLLRLHVESKVYHRILHELRKNIDSWILLKVCTSKVTVLLAHLFLKYMPFVNMAINMYQLCLVSYADD